MSRNRTKYLSNLIVIISQVNEARYVLIQDVLLIKLNNNYCLKESCYLSIYYHYIYNL